MTHFELLKMEIELQKINNIVIISNDAIIGNENPGMKKVSQLELDFLSDFRLLYA